MQNVENIFEKDDLKLNGEKQRLIAGIKLLQEEELAKINARSAQIEGTNRKIPIHIQEFLSSNPEYLEAKDLEIFKKFQEFMQRKDQIKSMKELERIMDYFNKYKLLYDKSARQFAALKNGASKDELDMIANETDPSQNSKYFMNYIVNVVEGFNVQLIAKIGYE